MYYDEDESCISDKEYDDISHQLVHLQSSVDEDTFKKSRYYYAMYDFDGSTGFDIPSRLNKKDKEYLTQMAGVIYSRWKSSTTYERRKEKLDATKRVRK